jgi:hypothetical protein
MVPFESDYGEKIPRAIPIIYAAGWDSPLKPDRGNLAVYPRVAGFAADGSAGLLAKEKRSLWG